MAKKKGYASIDDYLEKTQKVNGVKKDMDVFKAIIDAHAVTLGDGSIYPDDDLIVHGLKAGVKLHFLDVRPESDDFVADVDYRNRFMALKITKNPAFTEPGTIGLFGWGHFKNQKRNGKLLPTLQQLAGIDQSQVYNLSPKFFDMETRQGYPRWEELGSNKAADPAAAYTKIKSSKAGDPRYKRDAYGNRVVIDDVGSNESRAEAARIAAKYPDNALVFNRNADGGLEYSQGKYFGDSYTAPIASKLYLLQQNKKAISREEVKDIVARVARKTGGKMEVGKLTRKTLPADNNGASAASPDDIQLVEKP
ncbi:hypothetical protein [Pseudomonas sp. TE3786]